MLQVQSTQRRYGRYAQITPVPSPKPVVQPVWPSSFTSQPRSDAWIADEGDGVFALYVGDRCLAVLRGSALDQSSLNSLLNRLRHKPPRRRSQ